MLPNGIGRCPKCGLVYNRDLNACINIAPQVNEIC
jgi:transposase